MRGHEPGHARAPLLLAAEHAHVDRRLPQVLRRLDAGDGHEPDPRVLQLQQGLGENLAERLVDSAHPLGHTSTVAGDASRRCVTSSRSTAAELPLARGQIALGVGEQALRLPRFARDDRDREPRALPDVVMVDLGDRCGEAVPQLLLGRAHVHALLLQRVRLGEVQLGGEDPDPAGGH